MTLTREQIIQMKRDAKCDHMGDNWLTVCDMALHSLNKMTELKAAPQPKHLVRRGMRPFLLSRECTAGTNDEIASN